MPYEASSEIKRASVMKPFFIFLGSRLDTGVDRAIHSFGIRDNALYGSTGTVNGNAFHALKLTSVPETLSVTFA